MKKFLFLLACLATGAGAQAQNVDFGIKAGLAFNADSGAINAATTAYNAKGSGSVGWQAGALARVSLVGIYIQPELLYTSFKNEYTTEQGQDFNVTKSRIDLPINVGKKFLGIAHVQLGPVLSYYLDDNNNLTDFVQAKQDQFNAGFQIGAGVEFSNILINARYEMGFGKVGTVLQNNVTGTTYNVESRPQLLNVSVAYLF